MELFKLQGTIEVDNKSANKALDDTSQKGQDAEGKLSKVFSGIGKGAVAVGKTIGVGMVAAGTAVAGLTTKAIQSYADYEQLVGGVDTLFKDSSAKVQDYAKNAYKTAGLSANEYMETVTSFSASLLQSLDGDTNKAAEAANMAITDMSDNANKMGTSMEMIQNAYQGFAKQNYTMLDNLKLGYGGTKEEMQRLLTDAQAISGIEYDISSYADVVDAIHVIQTEMGITGTTAKEASSTISGSIASMKSSWQNLLTALVSGNGTDLNSYINNFVSSVSTVAGNLLPVISSALEGIVSLIEQLAPKIIGMLPNLVSTLLPAIIKAAVGLIQGIVAALPQLISVLVNDVLPNLISGIETIFNEIVAALPELIRTICEALPVLLPMLIDAIANMIITLCNSFSDIIMPIIDALPNIVISVVEALVENLPALIDGIITLVMGIVEAIPEIIQGIVDALPTIIELLITALLSNLPKIIAGLIQVVFGIVKSLPQIFASLIEGIVNIFVGIWNAIKNVFSKVGEWFSEKFGGASDGVKNVFSGIGDWFKGIWNGIKNAFSGVGDWFKGIFKGASDGVKNIFGGIGDWFSNIKNKIVSAFSNVKEKLSQPFEKARDAIKGVVDKVKGFFSGLKFEFPKIKLPKFSVSPSGWKIGDLLKGSIPKLSIQWNADAMRNPMIMTKPTVFGYDAGSGKLLGGGEAGSEVVSGTSTLMRMIQSAVAAQNEAVAYYLQKIIEILADYFPQILDEMGKVPVWDTGVAAAQLAPAMNIQLGTIRAKEERGR